MSKAKRIVEELKIIHEADAWHGPALRELLSDVTAEQAAARPRPGGHTIWELVLHIAAWEEVFNKRLKGHHVEVPEDGDFPPVKEESRAGWEKALARLESAHRQFLESISALSDADIQENVAGNDYPVGTLLRGAIRHHVYHTGQIGLLKKAFAR